MIVRKLEALFTINTNALQFQRATSELDKLADRAQSVMKGIASLWAVQALHNFVTNTAKAADQIGKTSLYLGVTTDALQELRYAAEKSGVSIDALEDAIKEIQVRAYDAKSGTGEAAQAFKDLELKATNAAGKIREPLDLLYEAADRLKALPHGDRVWMADAIFGDEGSMVLNMLKDGSLGLDAMRNEARALGILLSSDAIAKANRFNQALKKLQNVSSGIAKTFVEHLLPSLSWLMEKCAALSAAFNQVESRTSLVRTALIALGGILSLLAIKAVIAFKSIILFTGLIGIGIAAVALIIDDLWTAFKGGNSVFLNLHKKARAFFGPIEQWLLSLPKAFFNGLTTGVAQGLDWIQEKFAQFKNWLFEIASSLKNIFDGLMPDFLKKGFSATIKHVAGSADFQTPHQRWAQDASNATNHNRISSHQNVNVAVNVKSQAHPQEIGSEVSKAVRQALERERFNAFMGVTQYAG